MNTNADDAPVQDDPDKSTSDAAAESSTVEAPSDQHGDSADTGENTGTSEPTGDQLPDWELTPELVEEEAIRGDFMLRWAVVLLGVLYGFGQIADTDTLVHVKSGLYQLENGFLPPGKDVFSYTAADQDWVQLSWLFDLTVGLVYQAGGFVAVGVVKAILVGLLLYFVVHISRPNVPTWWTSVCGAALLVGITTQFTATPDLITMLGIAVLFWMLNRWQQSDGEKPPWQIAILFLFWANMDPRMYVGLAALLLYGIGDYIGTLTKSSQLSDAQRKKFWIAVGASFVAALLNPFGWHSLLAAQAQLADYAEFQKHLPVRAAHLWMLPLTESEFWDHIDLHSIVALSVVGVCVSAMILNAKRLDSGHVISVLGLAGLATLGSNELAPLAVMCAIFAGLNGQDIYLDNCRQTYSLAKGELIFSRAGRAVTVLSFVGLAYLMISGNLTRTTPRLGIGVSATLSTAIDAAERDMQEFGGERPFNFNLAHGDVLLWAGEKPFIDSRIGLFARGEKNIAEVHRKTRTALRFTTYDAAVWKSTRDEYQFTSLVPRLFEDSSSPADYMTVTHLLRQPHDWRMTHIGSGTIVFAPTHDETLDEIDPGLAGVAKEAFESRDDGGLNSRAAWARKPTAYEQYLTSHHEPVTPELLRSSHLSNLGDIFGQARPNLGFRERLALPYIAIRNANRTLAEEPQSATAYMVLGYAYRTLGEMEAFVASQSGGGYSFQYRLRQSVSAFWQAARITDHPQPWWQLYLAYSTQLGKIDLALDALNRFEDAAAKLAYPMNVSIDAERRQALREEMEDLIEKVEQLKGEALEAQGANTMQIAGQIWQQYNCTQIALDLLENDAELMQQGNPQVDLIRALLYIDIGDAESADLLLERMESTAQKEGITQWFTAYTTTRLAYGDYPQAIELYQSQIDDLAEANKKPLSMTSIAGLPFRAAMASDIFAHGWPHNQLQAVRTQVVDLPSQLAHMQFWIAVARLESGDSEGAAEILAEALERAPQSPMIALLASYANAITNEPIDLKQTYEWIDLDKDGHPVDKPENENDGNEDKDAAKTAQANAKNDSTSKPVSTND